MPQKKDIANFEDFTEVLRESEEILQQCFTQFALDQVFLSFNGGKDCTVLLDITINVLKEIYKQDDIAKRLKVVYMRTKGPFREIERFIKEIEAHYGIQLSVTEGEMKMALANVLEEDKRLRACLLGTRRTDPYSETLQFLQKTDPSWPQVLRVSPLLDWNYHQIWSYILQRNVPYCSLYGNGVPLVKSVRKIT
ncbi:FAD synthase-like isoform X2 [Leptidea sinapis]|uniref:FAD synthase-like isoform X2 n=1 Tax=Leptidea sinapis TaxID=189913 RepID=UPI0021C4B4AE|nr:FAD synthase-like isoform X2 [Leptidea sinapis]